MTDLVTRSGRCHGPGCDQPISKFNGSEDFCDETCQARWHAKWGAKMLIDERPSDEQVSVWLRSRSPMFLAEGTRVVFNGIDITEAIVTEVQLGSDGTATYQTEPVPCDADCGCRTTGLIGSVDTLIAELDEIPEPTPAQPATEQVSGSAYRDISPTRRRWWWSR